MDQRGAESDGGGDVDGFCPLVEIGPRFKALLGICIDALWTLYGVRHGQPDQGFVLFCQSTLCCRCFGIPGDEFISQRLTILAHVGELGQVFGFVIRCHGCSCNDKRLSHFFELSFVPARRARNRM